MSRDDFWQLARAAADGSFMNGKHAAKSSNQSVRIQSTNETKGNVMKTKSHSKNSKQEISNDNTQEEMTMKNKLDLKDSPLNEIVSNAPSAVPVAAAIIPSRTVLDQSTGKLVKFLNVVGTNPEVRDLMTEVGYSNAIHEKGWKTVRQADTARDDTGEVEPEDGEKAVTYLDGWIGPNFRRMQVMLKYDFADQEAYVFENVRITRGAAAVLSIATVLGRLDDLKSAPSRKATRKVDHEALAALATCGITEDERKRIGALVMIAETLGTSARSVPNVSARTQGLIAAHLFFTKWSELARAVITNRSTLISMGIGKRRTRGAASTAPPAPVAPQPVVVVTPATPAAPAIPQLPAAGQSTSTDSYHREHAAE